MAIITEKLQLNKHFVIIDSPVPFTLMANNGTDSVYRMAGAWQIDTWKLLPEEYMKQYPVFNLDLIYDDTNLNGGTVIVRESNIDVGDGISGVNGQDVKVTNFSDMPSVVLPDSYPVENIKDSSDNNIPLDVNVTNLSSIDLTPVAKENTLQDILNYLPKLKKKFRMIKNKGFNDVMQIFNQILSDLNIDVADCPILKQNSNQTDYLIPVNNFYIKAAITDNGNPMTLYGNSYVYKSSSGSTSVPCACLCLTITNTNAYFTPLATLNGSSFNPTTLDFDLYYEY